MGNKLAEQLADKVVGAVTKSGVREDILESLLDAVRNNVREAVVEAILVAVGHATVERDKAWVRELAGEWAPKSGLRTATTPAEVEREIRNWVAGRVAETRQTAFRAGYDEAFPAALEQGARLGWAAHEAGKTLEDVLKKLKSVRPS